MHSSKLYSILSHFDKLEQNRCRKYIQSPYFNKSDALIELYEILIIAINNNYNGELTREWVWGEIYKDQQFNDVRFRKLCSDLLKLIEGFLSQQVYEENPLHKATYLIEAVGRKKMDKLYNSTMKTARRLSDQQPFKPSSYYYYQYEIEKNFYELNEAENKRTERSNVEDIIRNLDYFYLGEKLRLYCSVISRQYLVSHEYELLFIDEIIEHIKNYKFDNIAPIAVYYQVYLTQKDGDNEDHYFKLKELLDQYWKQFPIAEAYHIYTYVINYCTRKINQGQKEFYEEYFNLNKDLLKREIIFVDGDLSPWRFKNIITVALRLGEYQWVESFIKNYSDRLAEEYRENAVSFNLAQLYFYQKKYDEVVRLLQTIEYEDINYNLNSKTMLLATYYETDEIEPLYSLLESFRVYLNRHKDIPKQRRENYKNLIKYTKKLTKITPGNRTAIKKLKEEISATKGIVSVKWLKEKIAEMEG